MAKLGLPDAPGTTVWRVIRAALRDADVFHDAGIKLVFYDGDRDSISDLASYQEPALEFFPSVGGTRWSDELSHAETLAIQVNCWLPVPDVEDVLNIQHAVETTLNTAGDAAGLQRDLVDADAYTGLIAFTQPLRLPTPRPNADAGFLTQGQFTVEVQRRFPTS